MKKPIQYRSPEELKAETDKKRKETSQFIKRLSKNKPSDLDKIVRQLHENYFSAFNCIDCANCCKSLGPRLTIPDIERISKSLRIKSISFIEKYIRIDEDGDRIFRDHPCPFLQPDNYCSVYEVRPKACKEYPHTDRNNFYQILEPTFKNCETCPVVFEIIRDLKNAYR
jgi:uncharacterized protein